MAKRTSDALNYDLQAAVPKVLSAPELPYQPQDPQTLRPRIGLIACGGITAHHLAAYRQAGYEVVALCDVILDRAEQRREAFYPKAKVYQRYQDLLARDDIDVVDIATHPPERPPIIADALRAGKHVLSQKPFVTDLAVGRELVDLADRVGRRLAVNQNGRWAPHFSYAREAIAAGLLGQLSAAHLAVHWDHNWTKGTPFEQVHHLVLYDFAIHWFDILSCFFGQRRPQSVYATVARSATQQVKPPLLAQVAVAFEGAQASLVFDADTRFGPLDHTYLTGSRGSLHSRGASTKNQVLTITTEEGEASPTLVGQWFDDGFHGTMGELLRAIEENRPPKHSAQNNLRSLELCFAAVASAERGVPVVPGSVQSLAEACASSS